MFERFTDRARRVLTLAQEESRTLQHSFIGTEHMLWALAAEGEGTERGVAARVLASLEITPEMIQAKIEETIGMVGTATDGSPPFTPRSKKVLELSLREALQMGHSYIGTEHILLGLIREGEGVGPVILLQLSGLDLDELRLKVIQSMVGDKAEEKVRVPPLPPRPEVFPGMKGHNCSTWYMTEGFEVEMPEYVIQLVSNFYGKSQVGVEFAQMLASFLDVLGLKVVPK